MTTAAPSTGSDVRSVAALCLPVVGLWVPLLGPVLSVVLALSLVPRAGTRLWVPHDVRRRGVALLGLAALWLPALLGVPVGPLAPVGRWLAGAEGDPVVGNTIWLLLPLCGPEQVLLPAAAATAVFVGGAVLSRSLRRAWPWVVGALASSLAYDAVIFVRDIDFIC